MSNEDILNMDSDAVEVAGRDFNAVAEEVEAAMNRMRHQVNNLSTSFQGVAAQAFYMKMDQMFQQMQLLVEEINQMGNDLVIMAAKVRQVQTEVRSLFQD